MDTITFCFINDCTITKQIMNLGQNWVMTLFALNMLWTTVFSIQMSDFSLINDYRFYHQVGESSSLLLSSIIGFKPQDAYDYDPDQSNYQDEI